MKKLLIILVTLVLTGGVATATETENTSQDSNYETTKVDLTEYGIWSATAEMPGNDSEASAGGTHINPETNEVEKVWYTMVQDGTYYEAWVYYP